MNIEYHSGKKWHYVVALIDGVKVGAIMWDGVSALHSIAVLDGYRRRGVATAMWRAAEERYGTTIETVATSVTTDGFGFFSTVIDGFDSDMTEVPDVWVSSLLERAV